MFAPCLARDKRHASLGLRQVLREASERANEELLLFFFQQARQPPGGTVLCLSVSEPNSVSLPCEGTSAAHRPAPPCPRVQDLETRLQRALNMDQYDVAQTIRKKIEGVRRRPADPPLEPAGRLAALAGERALACPPA